MLDVAAVAEQLLEGEPLRAAARDALALLCFLHDIGKIGPAFRAMLRDGTPQTYKHWEVSYGALHHHHAALMGHLGLSGGAFAPLLEATAGHHGRPFVPKGDRPSAIRRLCKTLSSEAVDAHRRIVALALALWPEASLAGLDAAEAGRLSWRLNGLLTAADWIGSNERWFMRDGWSPEPQAHLAQARRAAERAVFEAGVASGLDAGAAPLVAEPRPLQARAAAIALPEGPALAILEDETGAGKTEAALILARRMIAAGKARGLYVAMPTMATSDAMFARVKEMARRLLDGTPSLVLAHGRSDLHEGFRQVEGADAPSEDEPGCAPWLAESRRRAFMADIGVGTVDQALLGVLRTRFSALRLWGLSSKVLLVDEAHSYADGYTQTLLAELLRRHAALGGSAILLTATLPLALRQTLADAFAEGAGQAAPLLDDPAYPALTVPGAERATGFGRRSPKGPVAVRRLADEDAAEAAVAAAAEAGAAVAWVRNAVDDAVAAAERLRARGLTVDLLHARMALADRRRIDAGVLERFGKERAAKTGQVLVSTQVVESSLELDLDAMVSDLAPMAALIQRAGRLWRHLDLRPAAGRPVPGPLLHVLSPDPDTVADARWLSGALDRGAFVYDAATQWRTARALFDAGAITAPDGLRGLIEAVHGADAPDVPDALAGAEAEAEGAFYAERVVGDQNRIDFEKGYGRGAVGADDRSYPTRLGREQATLLLLRRGPDGLAPWAGPDGPESRSLSEVSVAKHRLDAIDLPPEDGPEIAALTRSWPDWQKPGGGAVRLCVVGPDGAIGEGLRYEAARGLLFDW